jgi:hypothetical protein
MTDKAEKRGQLIQLIRHLEQEKKLDRWRMKLRMARLDF